MPKPYTVLLINTLFETAETNKTVHGSAPNSGQHAWTPNSGHK